MMVLYLASVVELPQAWSNATEAKPVSVSDGWRRTVDGWEKRDQWRYPAGTPDVPPVAWRIHPALVAILQVLVSLFALISGQRSSTTHLTPQAAW
jgi:hypothetical protein